MVERATEQRADRRPLVLAWPAGASEDSNPYPLLFARALEGHGYEVRDFRGWSALWSLASGQAGVLHAHWPATFITQRSLLGAVARGLLVALALLVGRLRGTQLVWTVHNLVPHDARHRTLASWVNRLVSRWCAGSIHLSENGREQAFARYPALRRRPSEVIAHGTYLDWYQARPSRLEGRQRLGLQPSYAVLTAFGELRPYKNLPALITAFRSVEGDQYHLLIAGQLYGSADALRAAASDDPRITLRLERVADADVPYLMAASDLVVVAHSELLNSGAAILALEFGASILGPSNGALVDLAREHPQSVYTYRDHLSSRSLRRALEGVRADVQSESPAQVGAAWSAVGTQTALLYASVGVPMPRS